MGVDTRRPILPAPTESIVDTTGGSVTGTDLATDLSRRTDKTSYSIPDDGSPLTISTRRRHRDRGDDSKLSRSSHHSQTSLLIEYFEGGKGSGSLTSRPSVRVRVTPASIRKLRDQKDHIQISESSGNRRPVYPRRISVSSPSKQRTLVDPDDNSVSSSNSAIDENHHSSRHPPLEIEFVNRDQGSELSSVSRDRYIPPPTSDISSMPADSLLEASSAGPRRKRSSSLDRNDDSHESKVYLKTPTRQRSRSLSTERIAHRVAEKLSNDPRELSTGKKSRAYRDDDMASPVASLLSASAVSSHRKSGDQYSFRSGTSKSSINNPKLLETVEDAIRRLILPELKELKKDQKVISNTSKFERDLNASYTSSTSSPSRDELGRRLSKHASAPDVMKPKVVLNKDSKDEGIVLSGDSNPTKRERRTSKDSEKVEPAYAIWGNRPEMTEHDKLRRQRSKGLRDAEKAGIVGTALTTAALRRHESQSTIDQDEGKRSEDRNRHAGGGGINETELVFQKHNVAPMPMRSAVETELTRDSLLSQRTAGTATPRKETTVQDVPRGSPLQLASPASRTQIRTPFDSRHDLSLKHSNLSRHDLSIHSASDHSLHDRGHSPISQAAAGAIAAAAASNLLDVHSDRDSDFDDDDGDDDDYDDPRRRTLSPIQSVVSHQSDSHLEQYPVQHDEQGYSEGEKELEPRLSIESLTSAPSTSLARSSRPELRASCSEILRHRDEYDHELGYEETPTVSPRDEYWPDYRHSMAETADSDGKRLTNYTDDSEISYVKKISQGQRVAQGIGANPQFVQPLAVESAVASLLDPSTILDTKSNQSGGNPPPSQNLPQVLDSRSPKPLQQTPLGSRQGSPLKQRQDASSPDETSFSRRMGATSPPQSVTQSLEDQIDSPNAYADEHRSVETPVHRDREVSPDSESEINTNPSIIQGPARESKWTYNQTPPKGDQSPYYHEDADAAAGGAGLGLGYNQDYYAADGYGPDSYFDQPYAGGHRFGTPLGGKDEGYVSAANPLSPGGGTPEPIGKGFGGLDTNGMGLFDSPAGADDLIGPPHQRNLSGYSHGMGSPLYDGATGRGIDRIQSKDIIALMEHLTVRDAQRNARDTEILVTLVKSATEMRTSFEEMKRYIAQQDGMIMEASDRQHERTYKAVGGPRPLPASGSRSFRQPADDGEDLRRKRKSLFKRALKGLSLKSSNDLTKIEEMLEQLLEEVEALRAGQDDRSARNGRTAGSVDPEGYEPEGCAGSTSPGTHSGYLSSSSRPLQETRANGQGRGLENRVSTVPEGDEELFDERGEFLSPNLASPESADLRRERADSMPLSTSPRVPMASGALSSETSPKTTDKSRKHKSSSSSFFPKISRWSKTTASSMGDNIRNSIQPGRKERAYFDASRSGSDVAHGGVPYKTGDWYDPQGDDRLRSNFTLNDQQQENRPPSPLVPSQVSEPPKYRVHRDSLDLQHPQPRQGPTGRYQSQLETQAQMIYGMPTAGASSEQWGSNPSLSAVNNPNRAGSRLSPISDAGYSQASSRTGQPGPPRPPKIKDEGPLVPERPPKVREVERIASQNSLMRSPHGTPSPRKPTGPRPLTSGSQYSPGRRKRSQYRASPEQVDDEHDY